MNRESVPLHSPNIVTRKTGNEYVLVPVTNNIADMDSVYTLNETGAFIWECTDGTRTIGEITSMVAEQYDTTPDTAEADVLDFFKSMISHGIIRI